VTRTSPDLKVEVFRELALLPDSALSALGRAESYDIEQGKEWLGNLIDTVFPGGQDVAFYCLFEREELLALLPVRYVPDHGEILSLGNFYTSLYQPYLAAGLTVESLARLLEFIRDSNGTVSAMRFAPLDVDGRCYKLLFAATREARLVSFPFFCFGNWHLPVLTGYTSYISGRPSQIKNTIKRKSKEFQQAGGVLEIIYGTDRLEFGIAAYQSVYSSSWKIPEPFPEFIPSLIRMLARNGWLRLGVATLNEQPIAAQIWIVAHGRASIFKLAYREDFKRYSAGTLLSAKLMECAIDTDRVQEVDYLIGDDPYKTTWMTHRRERWGIIAYNPRSVLGAIGAAKERLGRLMKPVIIYLRNKAHRESSFLDSRSR
jgi:hypothetical protein